MARMRLEAFVITMELRRPSPGKKMGWRKKKTTPPLVALDETLEERQLLKKTVLAEHYPRDCMWQLWNLIVTYHAKDFPNRVTLAQLGLTLAVHTAGCERGFSVQNNILTPSRNRLTPVVQQKLIRVKLGPERASFNFQAALLKWRAVKDRRIYELKKTNPKL